MYEIKHYTDKKGKQVLELLNLNDGSTEYFGQALIKTPQGDVPIEFPILNISKISETFEKFESSLQAFIESKQEEISNLASEQNQAIQSQTNNDDSNSVIQFPESNV